MSHKKVEKSNFANPNILEALSRLSTERTENPKKAVSNSGDVSGEATRASIGKVAVLQSIRKTELIRAFHEGNTLKVIEILKELSDIDINFLNQDIELKRNIESTVRGFKESGDIRKAIELAYKSFKYGLNYESNPDNPITTRTAIVSGQKDCPVLTAHMMAEAIRCGLKFDEVMTRYTTVQARNSTRAIENSRAYADLALAVAEKSAMNKDSIETRKFYNVVLRQLGYPEVEFNEGEKSFLDVSERALLGGKIALELLDKQFVLNTDESINRIDQFIHDLRRVSVKLSGLNIYLIANDETKPRMRDEIMRVFKLSKSELEVNPEDLGERDLRQESDTLLTHALRLLSRAIKSYKIQSLTVNSLICDISKINLPFDKPTCGLIEKAVKGALDKDEVRKGIKWESIDILVQLLLKVETSETILLALIITSSSSDRGVLIHPITLSNLQEKLNQVEVPRHLTTRVETLPSILERACSLHGNVEASTTENLLTLKRTKIDGLRGGL